MTIDARKPPGELSPGEDFTAFCAVLYDPPPDAARIAVAAAMVRRLVAAPLHPGEFEALVSLALDAGEGRPGRTLSPTDVGRDGFNVTALGTPTEIFRLLDAGDHAGAGQQLLRWQAPKDVQALLIRRRRMCSLMLWEGLPWRWVAEASRAQPMLPAEEARRIAEVERQHITAAKPVEAAPVVETFTRSPARPLPGDDDPAAGSATSASRSALNPATGGGLSWPASTTLIVEPPARISPNTKRVEEVEYNLDPGAGLKPLDESERVDGLVWQRVAKWGVKFSAMGGFGSLGVNVSQALDAQDVNLIATGLDMAGDAAWFGGTYAASWVAKQYGTWKRKRGETRARQGLF